MYRLIRFGTTSLEYVNQVDDIGSGQTPTSYQLLPDGGALDNFGDLQKHPGVVQRSKTVRLMASTEAALEAIFLALLALRGMRDRLYRRTVSGDVHWIYARLVEVTARRDYQQAQYRLIQDVDLQFSVQEAFWHGDFGGQWYLDAGEYLNSGLVLDSGNVTSLDGSPKSITLNVGSTSDAGRAPSRAVKIIVTAGSAAITALQVERQDGETLVFSGTVAAGDDLVIDSGTLQVTNDGVDAYDDLSLTADADLAAWFALEPGDNDVIVTYSGGGTGSTIEFQYYEAWY